MAVACPNAFEAIVLIWHNLIVGVLFFFQIEF